MSIINVLLISLGLAMDAFAVSISNGMALKCFKKKIAFRVALFFGGFQAIMPVIGWAAGLSFRKYIESYDHWIAFVLLSFIGVKMIFESSGLEKNETSCNPENILFLFTMAVATSIDALAVGISFSCLRINIITPVIAIGLVTFVLSFSGVFLGNKFGSFFEKKMELLGGVILIGIGLKILLQHLFFM